MGDATADERESDHDVECSDDLWAGVSGAAATQRRSFILRLHCVGCNCVHPPVNDHRKRLEALLGDATGDESKLLPALDAVMDRAAQQWRAVQSRLPCQAKMATLHALFDPAASVATYDANDLPSSELWHQPTSTVSAQAATDTFGQWSSQADAAFCNQSRQRAARTRVQTESALEACRMFAPAPPAVAQLGNMIFALDVFGDFACITFEHPNSPSKPLTQAGEGVAAKCSPTVVKVSCNCVPTHQDFFCKLAAGALRNLSGHTPSKVSSSALSS